MADRLETLLAWAKAEAKDNRAEAVAAAVSHDYTRANHFNAKALALEELPDALSAISAPISEAQREGDAAGPKEEGQIAFEARHEGYIDADVGVLPWDQQEPFIRGIWAHVERAVRIAYVPVAREGLAGRLAELSAAVEVEIDALEGTAAKVRNGASGDKVAAWIEMSVRGLRAATPSGAPDALAALWRIAAKCELARSIYATEKKATPSNVAECFAHLRDVARAALTTALLSTTQTED